MTVLAGPAAPEGLCQYLLVRCSAIGCQSNHLQFDSDLV